MAQNDTNGIEVLTPALINVNTQSVEVVPILIVFPNPTSNQVWVQYSPGLDHIAVLDAAGRSVLEVVPLGTTTSILQVEGLAPACYSLVATDSSGQVHYRKFVKQ